MPNQKWTGTLTLLSPLAHASDETLSVDTMFRRIRILFEDKPVEIPIYSGNALRGRLRRKIMQDLIGLVGGGKAPDNFYYMLFCGGALEKGGGKAALDVAWRRKIREAIPPISLLGTAHQNAMVQGKLRVGICLPVAAETAAFTGIASDLSVWELVDSVFYTRLDDLDEKTDTDRTQQMKYSIEMLVPGAVLSSTFTLMDPSPVELSCFGRMMRLFEADPVIGGKSATGHGQVALEYSPEWPDDAAYLEHVEAKKEDIRDILHLVGRVDVDSDDPGAVFDDSDAAPDTAPDAAPDK